MPRRASSGLAGFSLVEIAMALGIVAFVLVALIGLAGTALRSSGESSKSIEAANAASQIVARWRSILEWNSRPGNMTPTSQPADLPIQIAIPNPGNSLSSSPDVILVNGEGEVEGSPSGQKFRVDYEIERPAQTPGMVRLHLRLSWPPQAPAGSTARDSYEIVTGMLLGST